MDPIDIENCLSSMSILIDTREQPSERAQKRYKSFGCPFRRQKLDYGDYTYNFTLPDGSELYKADETIKPSVIIERKMNLEELSNNLTRERSRFAREFERASEAAIYLLIEDGSWKHIITGRYKTKFNQYAYFAGLVAFMARYRLQVVFCPPELSGRMIHEILYRELKERLTKGDYG